MKIAGKHILLLGFGFSVTSGLFQAAWAEGADAISNVETNAAEVVDAPPFRPVQQEAQPQGQSQAQSQEGSPAPSSDPVSPVVAEIPIATGDDKSAQVDADENRSQVKTYGPVRNGENIYQIAKSLFPERGSRLDDIVAAFVRMNPDAFPGKNPNLLQAGVTLVVPSIEDVRPGEWKALVAAVAAQSQAGEAAVPKQPVKAVASPSVEHQAMPSQPVLPPPPIPAKSPSLYTPLPGVGSLPGNIPMNNTIRVHENSAEAVPIALRFANRISTPFANPMVIDASSWEIKKNGNSIFVKPTSPEPVAIYITGDQKGDPTISVVLVPQDIPPQTVSLQLDKDARVLAGNDDAESEQIMKASSYNERIQAIMKAAALGKTMPGYSEGPLPHTESYSENLKIVPERRYSGRFDDVYVYWISNNSSGEIELDESIFYEDGIRAIAFYPEIRLAPGQGTRMFVMSDNGRGEK